MFSIIERIGLLGWLSPEQMRDAERISTENTSKDQASGIPARLVRICEELGPAFVKLGQTLAVREDLLPPEYLREFRKLHANVATLPFEVVKRVLSEELGAERLQEYAKIEEAPLAAGSIAQVHRAVLTSGEQVVIKVQRPNIAAQIESDLSLMEEIASLFEKFLPEIRYARPVTTVGELRRAILGELDFIREAGNMSKMAKNFAADPNIEIPTVFWQLTTERVLTISFLEGVPAWERDAIVAAGNDPVLLVERGLEMFLKMVFVDGLYHGDLHPGNLRALPNSRVGVLDFGITVYLGKATREHLAGLLAALVKEDFERVVAHFIELADPPAAFDVESFQYEVRNTVAPFIGLSLKQIRSGKLFWDLAKVAANHGAPMPQELIIFLKTLVTFEGIGSHLSPSFDLMHTCEKFATRIREELYSPESFKQTGLVLARDIGTLVRQAPYQLRRLLRAALDGELAIRVNSEEAHLLRAAVDLAGARIGAGLASIALIAGGGVLSLTVSSNMPRILGMPAIGFAGCVTGSLLVFWLVWSTILGRTRR